MSTSHPVRRGRKPPVGEPVIDRGLALLAAFDREHPSLGLSELSRRSGLPKSSAARLARRLEAWGALERDAHGHYVVGLRLLMVASLAPRGHGLREVAVPFMSDLAEAVRHHVLLVVREGDEGVLVDRISSRGAVTVYYQPGDRLPLHATGAGRILLAHAPHELHHEILGRDLMLEPEGIRVAPDSLRRVRAAARTNGYTIFRRPGPPAVVSVAAPVVTQTGAVVAAPSVVVPDQVQPQRLTAAVTASAHGISRMLAVPM